MSRRPLSSISARAMLSALVIVLASGNILPCPPGPPNDRETRLIMEGRLRTLWNGTPEQRIRAAEGASLMAALVRLEPPDPDLMTSETIVASLVRFVMLEPDDYVVSRTLNGLLRESVDESPLTPVFLQALQHHSPNVREKAVLFFRWAESEEARPLLEAAWRADRDRWFRSDLMSALVSRGSTRFLDDFVEIARSEDVETAVSAIQALGQDGSEKAVAVLAELAGSSSDLVAYDALWTLSPKNNSEEALSAILGLTRSESAALRTNAAMLLESFRQEDATLRLAEIARSNDDPEVRFAALCALDGRSHPAVVPALMTAAGRVSDAGPISRAAATMLVARGIGAARPETANRQRELPCFLSRQWPNHMHRFRAEPPPGGDVATCRSAPGNETHIRVPADEEFYDLGRFERDGVVWLHMMANMQPCWIPEHDVTFVEPRLPDPRDWKPWARLREKPDPLVSAR